MSNFTQLQYFYEGAILMACSADVLLPNQHVCFYYWDSNSGKEHHSSPYLKMTLS
jgi:hypothetical protein